MSIINMQLFDDIVRDFDGIGKHGEDTFHFLNRSTRPAAERVRLELERWFANYPDTAKFGLRARFRANFESPFFELALHEIFHRTGAKVSLEHQIGTSGKHPDYLVQYSSTNQFIVEATLCIDEGEGLADQDRKMSAVYNAINELSSKHFHLAITDIAIATGQQITPKQVVAFLRRKLEKIDPEAYLQSYEKTHEATRLRFESANGSMEFIVLPKSRSSWGTPSQLIGMHQMRFRWGGAEQKYKKCLSAKSTHYGRTNYPFVIATNVLSAWGVEIKEQQHALYGETYESVSGLTGEIKFRHINNGFWGHSAKPVNRRISAVLFGTVTPWNLCRSTPCLYHNPWADYPLSTTELPFSQAVWNNGLVTLTASKTDIASLFGLPLDWPGALFE